jgi:hypothetical protein
MESTQKFGFHEAGLTGIRRAADGTIYILLEGVHVDDQTPNASACLKGVRQIVRDGSVIDDFTMEYEDGEVLTLEYTPDSVRLIVEWNDFQNHHQTTRSYQIVCESVRIELS